MGQLVRRVWQADFGAYGGRKARQAFSYDAYVPEHVAQLEPHLPAEIVQVVLEAQRAIEQLNDHEHATSLEAVARPLLRAESVASSRIEGLSLSQRRVAEALFDPVHSDITAQSVLNNILAMEAAIALGDAETPVRVDDLLWVHRTLLDTPGDARLAGVIRTTQNWIGGSQNSPRDAAFIPPPPEEVPALLEDLCAFLAREDLPAIVQAAIAHAQFETIHPFGDGNGRVGRCLIHVVLRRRGLGRRYVPPVSVILATNARAYIGGLTAYRAGELDEWLGIFAAAMRTAGSQALSLAERLEQLQQSWWERAGRPRRGSGAARLIALLPAYPILDAATVAQAIGSSLRVARLAIGPLAGAGILTQITLGRRNRAWAAKDVFALINAFEWDLATPEDEAQPRRPSPTRGRRVHETPAGT
jgi:Fic family protein